MEMPQIRYFLALSEELNFTRAAKQCGVSQPSLTNGIIELERRFGGALFRRKSGVALTVLGRASLASPIIDCEQVAEPSPPRTWLTTPERVRDGPAPDPRQASP